MLILQPLLVAEGGVKRAGYVCGPATDSSAFCSAGGRTFPRFSARRRIPAQAFELKKNRCGIKPVSSTCDNEHTAASLGQAEILGIKDAPRDCSFGSKNKACIRPFTGRHKWLIATGQCGDEASESVVLSAEDSGDVLPHDDGGLFASGNSNMVNCIGDLAESQGQIAARIVKRAAQAGNGKRLARRPSREHVGRFHFPGQHKPGDRGHVAEVRHVGVVVREHRAGEGLNLGEPCGLPAQRMPCNGCGLNAAANRTEAHHGTPAIGRMSPATSRRT